MKLAKLIWTVVIVVLLVAGGLFAYDLFMPVAYRLLLNGRSQRTLWLIPAGYEGPVSVFHNRQDGKPRIYEGDDLIYDFRSDKVLKFAEKGPSFIKEEFYYVQPDGSRIKIQVIPPEACHSSEQILMTIFVLDCWTPGGVSQRSYIIGRMRDKEILLAQLRRQYQQAPHSGQ